MAHRKTSKRSKAKAMLRLADLEQSKIAVLHSHGAASSQESYGHAIDEFIGWYCSEPRLAFNRTVVLRYRSANPSFIRIVEGLPVTRPESGVADSGRERYPISTL